MARRRFNVFSLSFLDVMACGLGAVILFLMIVSAEVALRADRLTAQRLAESSLLEEEILVGRKNLVRLRNSLDSVTQKEVAASGEARRLQELIRRLEEELAENRDDTVARRESVEQLRADIKRLEEANRRLSARAAEQSPDTGQRIRSFVGEGNRQYLTGMRMGGQRVLILVDASTSMLGRSYVDVVRFRVLGDARKVRAPKWQQALDTVDWLTTQIRPGTRFQVYAFNEEAHSVVDGTDGQWLEASDGTVLTRAVENLRKIVPERGTSLMRAFEAIEALNPRPDNLYLITDGLPTQGKNTPARLESVRPDQRVSYFSQAVKALPGRIPVNVLLFPMDGDPDAAGYFWALATDTRGSFLTPSRDWP